MVDVKDGTARSTSPLGESKANGVGELVETLQQRVAVLEDALRSARDDLTLRAEVDVLVAHEIRTPLTVVLGAFQNLAAEALDPADRDLLISAGLRQSHAARATVEDLMRPGTHPAHLVPRASLEAVDLADLIDEVIDRYVRTRREASTIHTVGFDRRVTSSPARLRAILGNFIENAITFGAGSPIHCEAILSDHSLTLSVSDRGPGLGGRRAAELFQPGYEGAAHRMGLYIARMIARSLGGDAFVVQRPGGGTTAFAQLPQRRPGDTSSPG